MLVENIDFRRIRDEHASRPEMYLRCLDGWKRRDPAATARGLLTCSVICSLAQTWLLFVGGLPYFWRPRGGRHTGRGTAGPRLNKAARKRAAERAVPARPGHTGRRSTFAEYGPVKDLCLYEPCKAALVSFRSTAAAYKVGPESRPQGLGVAQRGTAWGGKDLTAVRLPLVGRA